MLTANKGFDEIQAEDNRRQMIAGKAGINLSTFPGLIGRHDPELVEMFKQYMKDTETPVEKALPEFIKNHPDFVLSDADKKEFEAAKKEGEAQAKLLKEAEENEYKVTDTSTGLPKAPPVYTDDEKEEMERRKKVLAESSKRELAAAKPIATQANVGEHKDDKSDKKDK